MNAASDRQRVHQLLRSFIQGEVAEKWIKRLMRHRDGRCDMVALRAHFAGEGNSTRRIAEAQRLRETLHCKSECR